MNIHDATEEAYKRGKEDGKAEIDRLEGENRELKYLCDRIVDEKSKLGLMYDRLLKEKSDLDRKIGFLEGQIEAYQFIWNSRR